MKKLSELTDENYIAIAKIIDNNFIGNKNITVYPRKMGQVKINGYTEGGQCISCQVLIDIYMNKLRGVFTQNDNPYLVGNFRHVLPPTLKKVIDYLKDNDFDYCPTL